MYISLYIYTYIHMYISLYIYIYIYSTHIIRAPGFHAAGRGLPVERLLQEAVQHTYDDLSLSLSPSLSLYIYTHTLFI